MAAMLEYEYRVLTFDRHTSKAAARQEIREHAGGPVVVVPIVADDAAELRLEARR